MADTRMDVDCATGEVTSRELTTKEQTELDNLRARWETLEAEQQAVDDAKAAAKASGDAKLKELGLTDDEIAAR
jgi:hypothetical protein